jgi:hypothetical protein
MRLAVLARGPLALLPALGGALLMLGVLGPDLRGAAAATLAGAGGLALALRSRPSVNEVVPAVRVLERVHLGPRQTLVLVEVAARRYLVATGATVASLPLEDHG